MTGIFDSVIVNKHRVTEAFGEGEREGGEERGLEALSTFSIRCRRRRRRRRDESPNLECQIVTRRQPGL